VLNVPVRGIACGLSGWLGSIVMVASGGARYPLAAEIIEEGCSGPWIITPQMIYEDRSTQEDIDGTAARARQQPSGTATVEHVTTTVHEPDSLSSLEAVRRGQVPSTSPSSPLGEIYFDFDRYDLRADARKTLGTHADWLKANPSAQVEIEGHCDERGSNEYNMALGSKRAQTTKEYLVSLGIAATRLLTISYGEELPVCREHAEECWQRNRRARFVIVPAGSAS
jgi:peptidoglycan-associated lipoprotein